MATKQLIHDPARLPVGYVEAVVRFPLYEGDKMTQDFQSSVDYIIEQGGINDQGQLITVRRECECLEATVTTDTQEG